MEIQYELQPEDESDIALPLMQNVVNDHIYASSEPTLITLSHSKVNKQEIENENITDTESSAAGSTSKIKQTNQFMGLDQQLFQLFNVCRHAGCGKEIKNPMEFHTKGLAAIITVTCPNGHTYSWDSRPMIGNMFAANMIVASAVFLTGNSFTSFLELCDVIQLQSLKER